MNQLVKQLVTVKIVKNYLPCREDCICVRILNLQDSYQDRFLYKKCFERNKMYTSASTIDFMKRLSAEKKYSP